MTDKKTPENVEKLAKEIENSLSGLTENLISGSNFNTNAASTLNGLYEANRYDLISNQRQLLSELYTEHGIIQTLCEQPVLDAFRHGFEILTEQLSPDEVKELQNELESSGAIKALKEGFTWTRLFGGGGIIAITAQDPATPLDAKSLKSFSTLDFVAADLWELYDNQQNITGRADRKGRDNPYYSYYSQQIHYSRVEIMQGKAPPSFTRPRLRGWGMSELERLVRSFKQYIKNQNVIYEILDEAKVDVYKIEGYNSSLLNGAAQNAVQRRIELSNMLKNFLSAITMDTQDDYQQKQMNFSGLGEMMRQVREQIASDLKMPVTKLFGVSSAGFNSGEDDIENYNSMVEGEVREPSKKVIKSLVQLCCQKLFGFQLDDLEIEFEPLRMLNAEQEQNVKNSQANRILSFYQMGLISPQEAKRAITSDNLIGAPIDDDSEEVYQVASESELPQLIAAPDSANLETAKKEDATTSKPDKP